MADRPPRPRPTPEERRASNARDKADLFKFLGSIVEPAVMGGARFLDEHPENVVSQVARDPFVKATIQFAASVAAQARAEAEAAAEAEERARRGGG